MSILDLVLRLDEADLHEILWTEDLLTELADKWVEKGVRTRTSADRVCTAIRSAFPEQEIARTEYDHLIALMPGKDPDDHLHSAAAVARAPSVIITANVKDFPAKPLAELGVTVQRSDAYLCELAELHAKDVRDVIIAMSDDRKDPPMTPSQVLDALAHAGVARFADQLRPTIP